MALFDIFSNDAATQAANSNRQLYADNAAKANGLFNNYGTTANNALSTGLANSTGAINTGMTAAGAANTSAISAYQPLTSLAGKYGTGTSLFLDALGANGAGGTTRAQDAFTAGPGYQWQVDQALKGVENSAAARGGALSGNAIAAVNDRASGLAKQEYGSWLDRLGGLVNPELQATSGAATGTATGYRSLADMISSGYGNLAGLYGSDATNRVGVAGNVTSGINSANKDVTSGLASANNAEAQAAQNGSATFWNGLFSLGGNAARGFLSGPATPRAAA